MVCCVTFSLLSCHSGPPVSETLKGQWKLVKEIADDNGNGTLDSSDKKKNLGDALMTITFNPTGTMIVSYDGASNADAPGENTWELEAGNTYLKIVNNAPATASTTHFHIEEITAKSMVLKDTSDGVVTWVYWEKMK